MRQTTIIFLVSILMLGICSGIWAEKPDSGAQKVIVPEGSIPAADDRSDIVYVGIDNDGLVAYNVLPITTYYGYSYSQQIYTPAQIGHAGTITQISFLFNSGQSQNSSSWEIYMGHTSKNSFSSTTDWINASQMTKVFDGTVNIPDPGNWMDMITLNTPFFYNNANNLVIAVREKSSGYADNNGYWVDFPTESNRAIYYRNDTTLPDPSSPPTANGRLGYVNVLMLNMVLPITSFPWEESFEADSPTRTGWTQIQEDGNASWTWESGSTGVITSAYDGSLNARFVRQSGSGTPQTKLVSPLLDLSSGTDYKLSFWYGQPMVDNNTNRTKVYYRTSPSGNWTQIKEYTSDVSSWIQEPGIALPNPGATYQIAIEGINNNGHANVIDKLRVFSDTPFCLVTPSEKHFGKIGVGESSAEQEFTIKNAGGGTLSISNIQLGGTHPTEFTLTQNNSLPKDLGAGESITVKVSFSPASSGEKSASLLVTDNLGRSVKTIPLSGIGAYLCFYENWDESISDWYVAQSSQTNYWTIANGTSYGPGYCAYITNNSQTLQNQYTFNSASVSHLYKDVTFPAGTDFKLNYMWKSNGQSNNDDLRVFLVDTSTSPVAGTQLSGHLGTYQGQTTWQSASINLNNVASSTKRLVFSWRNNANVGNNPPAAIDDIYIEYNPGTAQFSVNPASHNFYYQNIDEESLEQEFVIRNPAGGTLTISSVQLSGTDAADFILRDSNTYPKNLGYNQSITVKVCFKPGSIGAKSANLAITDNLGRTVNNVPLSGYGSYLVFGDGFETYDDFTLNLTPWTQYDGDGSPTYSFTYGEIPIEHPNAGYTGSFIVFNPSQTNPPIVSAVPAYSGSKFAACIGATNLANNDWLITPRLYLNSSPYVSFWAKHIEGDGSSRFKVLYSTTGNDPEDFVDYLAGSATDYVSASDDWAHYGYELPDSCENSYVYIAIQCVSDQGWFFLVDNFAVYSDQQPVPMFSIEPSSYSFPDFPFNYDRYGVFEVKNEGGGTIQIWEESIEIVGELSFYFVLDNLPEFPWNLGPYESARFGVKFRADEPGEYNAAIQINDNLSKAIHTIPLFATALDNNVIDFPYIEGAEEDVFGWITRDVDGDGLLWYLYESRENSKSGRYCLASNSWIQDQARGRGVDKTTMQAQTLSVSKRADVSPHTKSTALDSFSNAYSQNRLGLTPDNWLFSPVFNVGEDYLLTWWVRAASADNPAEHYSVYISTTTPDVDEFTEMHNETLTDGQWQYRTLNLKDPDGTYDFSHNQVYIAFRHYDCTDQASLLLDEIRVLADNTGVNQALVSGGTASMLINPDYDIEGYHGQRMPVELSIDDPSIADDTVLTAQVGYGNPSLEIANAGLFFNLGGASLSGCTITVNHNIGFIPLQAAWRCKPDGWTIINENTPGVTSYDENQLVIQLPDFRAVGDLEMVFPKDASSTLPIQLSSFTANVSPSHQVQLIWVTQSETNILGYHIYRGESLVFADALKLDAFIEATNTSQQQVYVFTDTELCHSGVYYYWLEHLEMDGTSVLHYPLQVVYAQNDTQTPIPPILAGIAAIYPNPFNPNATIRFGIKEDGAYTLKIYNVKGQLVKNLASGTLPKGYHTHVWDGKDERGKSCASGVYFAVLNTSNKTYSKKMIMSK